MRVGPPSSIPKAGFRRFYRDSHRRLLLCVAGSVLRALFILPTSLLVKLAIDDLVNHDGSTRLVLIIGLMTLTQLLASLLALVVTVASAKLTANAALELRRELADNALSMPREAVTQQDPSVIQSIMVTETDRAATLISTVVNMVLPSALTLLAVGLLLVVMDPLLGIAALSATPIAALINRKLQRRMEGDAAARRADLWNLHTRVYRLGQLWDLTTAHTAEAVERDSVGQRSEAVARSSQQFEKATAIYQQVQGLTITLAGALVLLVGGLEVQRGSMTVSDFLSFFVVMSFAQQAGRSLLNGLPAVVAGRESLTAVYRWLDVDHDPVYVGTGLPDLDGSFSFDHVSFGYGEQPLLRDVNLRVESGDMIGIAGKNGAGKTTMVNLLLGWYRPVRGQLTAGGVAYDDINVVHLRRSMALVHQDPAFFEGTVRANVSYGVEVTDDEIFAAAALAGADDMLRGLPRGLDTEMGDHGVLLSGGQRQRIALTRALVRRPKLIVLDEPSNHVDRISVSRLLANLRNYPERPTILVISHDVEVLASMDRVCHLTAGCLLEPEARAAG